jgi:imidazolonepropionase-like amidohydrolase
MRSLATFWFSAASAFCLLLTPVSGAQNKPASTPVIIAHVTVINPGTSSVQANRTVVITEDHITSVSDAANFQPPKNARVIDATGQYLIPGLWDMHVHSAFGD